MRKIIIFFTVFSAFLLTACQPGQSEYQLGNQAYMACDYQTAFKHYLYAANKDVAPAQYAVGYMYYYGLGTKKNTVKGVEWLEKAAPHSVKATYALQQIQQNTPNQPWTFQYKKP